nr:MAG TPA: hypothetical protein [Myoviridae sp. ctfuG5]
MINLNNVKIVKARKYPYYMYHTVHDPLTGRTHRLMWKHDRNSVTPVKFV